MKRLLFLSFLLLAATAVRAGTPDLTPPEPDAGAAAWADFSENLVVALGTDNLGLRCSALQHVVTYGDHLDVRAARFDVVRLFRDNPDERVRMLALSALAQINDPWVADFLSRSARFEKNARLAHLYRQAAHASAERAG